MPGCSAAAKHAAGAEARQAVACGQTQAGALAAVESTLMPMRRRRICLIHRLGSMPRLSAR